jgi:N-acetylmuramoyl-L-alanine amidase
VSRSRRSVVSTIAAVFALLALDMAAVVFAGRQMFVERIRYIGTAAYSRVVIDTSGPVDYRMTPVLPDANNGPPDRLVIDVRGAKIGPEAREALTIGDALMRGIRTGQHDAGTARIVLDLAADADARIFALPDPYRLVIDLKAKGARPTRDEPVRRLDTARGDGARPVELPGVVPSPPAPASEPYHQPTPSNRCCARSARKADEPKQPAVVEHRLKVVLDPGHGGKDPGAEGVRGIQEKDVTLAIAALVARKLAADPGIEVAMTRTDDRYLSLEERTAFANAQAADLFVSVHGNASTNSGLSGVEVYYLNNTDNRGTLRLAAMENNLQWDPHNPRLQSAIPDLSYILSDLRQTYKVEESKQLAENLQRSVVTRLGDRYGGVDDLGVKEGPFYVLVGAYMPCVLIEVSFLTNPLEGVRLGTDAYRTTLADGIYEGIRRYLSQTKLAKTL